MRFYSSRQPIRLNIGNEPRFLLIIYLCHVLQNEMCFFCNDYRAATCANGRDVRHGDIGFLYTVAAYSARYGEWFDTLPLGSSTDTIIVATNFMTPETRCPQYDNGSGLVSRLFVIDGVCPSFAASLLTCNRLFFEMTNFAANCTFRKLLIACHHYSHNI